MHVYVLGDINADVTTDLSTYPNEGDDSEITQIAWHSGGSAVNTATVLALLGSETRLLGRVGTDPAAAIALRAAERAGVALHLVQHDDVVATGTCIVAISPNGQRTFLSFRGANVLLDSNAWAHDMFGPDCALHVCAHSLLNGPQQHSARRAIEAAHEQGAIVSLDLCAPTIRAQPALLATLLPMVHFLFMNEMELQLLHPGLSISSALRQLVADGVSVVALKRGDQGCTVVTQSEWLDLAAMPVQACDTNGCGDAFAAGFVWAHVQGGSLLACGALANLVGGLTATRAGAAAAAPTRAELVATVRQHTDWVGSAVVTELLKVAESFSLERN